MALIPQIIMNAIMNHCVGYIYVQHTIPVNVISFIKYTSSNMCPSRALSSTGFLNSAKVHLHRVHFEATITS